MKSAVMEKADVLRANGTFNARAERVSDGLFAADEFFDARDMVQVKYEMLRRVRKDGVSVAKASAEFGFSRVAFYDIQRAWMRDGMNGLLPRPRGPKHGHKLTEDVIAFARSNLTENPSLRAADLVGRIAERFDIKVHPRTVERALAKEPKKGLPA